eukprot:g10844.t1
MSKYEVLGVSRSAPFQEIKRAYQAAALASHPDKQANLGTEVLKKQASKRFLLVQEAWETLRDEDLRREYDCRLDLQARNVVVSDEVDVNEMHYDETDGGSFSHECRCGEAYVVTRGELREGFEVVDCAGCSLYIRVVGTPAEEGPSVVRAAGVTRRPGDVVARASARDDDEMLSDTSQAGEAELEEMERWLDEAGVDRRGGGKGAPSATLRQFPGRGIGLEAAVDLERDSTVASIPRRVCLSSDAEDAPAGTLRAFAHALMASAPSSTASNPEGAGAFEPDVAVVTLQLFLERTAGARSALAPWMALLDGKADLNLPALWPTRDLEALRGTLVLQEVQACLARAKVERDVVAAVIANVLGENREAGWGVAADTNKLLGSRWLDFKGMEGKPTPREWLQARCTVQSRAYRVGGRYLLIPLVDFANHDDEVAYAVCPGDGVFTGLDEVVFVADRSYHPGQEICTTYGDMDNAKRLFSFGFVTLHQPAQRSQPSPVDQLALPTEAFCDISFDLASSGDALRSFKEGVLREHGRTGDGASALSAVFPLTPDRPLVWQLVEGPAQAFVAAAMPVVRLVALTVEEFAREEAFWDFCQQPRRGDLAAAAFDKSVESGLVDGRVGTFPTLAAGKGSRVLERLGGRLSPENEREAMRLLRERCSSRLRETRPTSRDVAALREAFKESNGAETFAASAPRSLLCATVRVGEAIAWHALLEVCGGGTGAAAPERSELTWASWIAESCESTG